MYRSVKALAKIYLVTFRCDLSSFGLVSYFGMLTEAFRCRLARMPT